jgi:hypothetical protein
MKSTLFLLSFFFVSISLSAQSGPYMLTGAGALGNGQIGLLLDDAEAAIALPALLAEREHGGWTVGASKRTALEDFTEVVAAAHLKLPWKDQIAISVQHNGIEGYSEQRIVLGYARRLFQKLNAAVQFDFNRNAADEYEDLYGISWAISLHAPLTKQVSLSAWAYNPLGVESDLDLPSMIRVGILYAPSEKIGVAVEVEKDWRQDMRLKAGINYRIHPRLALRWGVGTSPSLVHAGISWNILHNMSVTGGWRYHSKLGSSLAASVSQYNAQ